MLTDNICRFSPFGRSSLHLKLEAINPVSISLNFWQFDLEICQKSSISILGWRLYNQFTSATRRTSISRKPGVRIGGPLGSEWRLSWSVSVERNSHTFSTALTHSALNSVPLELHRNQIPLALRSPNRDQNPGHLWNSTCQKLITFGLWVEDGIPTLGSHQRGLGWWPRCAKAMMANYRARISIHNGNAIINSWADIFFFAMEQPRSR